MYTIYFISHIISENIASQVAESRALGLEWFVKMVIINNNCIMSGPNISLAESLRVALPAVRLTIHLSYAENDGNTR